MNTGDSQSSDLAAIELRRYLLHAQIQQAAAVSQGVLRKSTSVLPLLESLNAAAALELAARDHGNVCKFANWAVQLCEDALAEERDNRRIQNQLLAAFGTLKDVHVADGRLDAAADCCLKIAGILQQQYEFNDDPRETDLAFVRNQFELASIRRLQQRLDEAGLVANEAAEIASELANQFPDDPCCQEALARGNRLEHEIDVEQWQVLARLAEEKSRRTRGKMTAGAVIALVIFTIGKFAFRGGFGGGNGPAPALVIHPDAFTNLFDSTIEFINESPNSCSVRLLGRNSGRRKSYTKQLEPGPAAEVRQSLEMFAVDRVVVESAGQSRTTNIRFELPDRGLAQLKVDANLGVRLILVSRKYRPQGPIAKPVDEGPIQRRKN